MDILDASKPHACLLCDKRFRRRYDLSRHDQTVHDEKVHNSEPPYKMRKVQESETENYETDSSQNEDGNESNECDSESESGEYDSYESDSESDSEESDENADSSDSEDNTVYQLWLNESKADTVDMWTEKYQKYVTEGLPEADSFEKSSVKTLWAVKRSFFNKYKAFLSKYLHLKDDETFQVIVDEIEQKVDKGLSIHQAIKRVIPKHQAKFDGVFLQESDEDEPDEPEDPKEPNDSDDKES